MHTIIGKIAAAAIASVSLGHARPTAGRPPERGVRAPIR